MKTKNLSRRDFLKLSSVGVVGMSLESERGQWLHGLAAPTEYFLYVGSYTSAGGAGITLCRLTLSTGALQKVSVTTNVAEPSFLATDRQGRYLYAVNELGSFQGQSSGAVSAFSIHPTTRALTLINQVATRGGAPCHVSLDGQDKYVMVANYSGGNVTVFPVRTDGGLGTSTDMEQFSGSGPHPNQASPHAHEILTDSTNQYALAADLGSDKVRIFRFNGSAGTLTTATQASFSTKPGAGPRHFAFHPNGRFVFVINELNSTLTSLAFNASQGTLTEVRTVSTLPSGYTGTSYCAEVRVSADGRFLYGSNRGHNSLVVFALDSAGVPSLVQHISTQGTWPRDFILDPSGAYVLVANQNSNTIATFRRDSSTGKLSVLGSPLAITAPTSLLVANTPA